MIDLSTFKHYSDILLSVQNRLNVMSSKYYSVIIGNRLKWNIFVIPVNFHQLDIIYVNCIIRGKRLLPIESLWQASTKVLGINEHTFDKPITLAIKGLHFPCLCINYYVFLFTKPILAFSIFDCILDMLKHNKLIFNI